MVLPFFVHWAVLASRPLWGNLPVGMLYPVVVERLSVWLSQPGGESSKSCRTGQIEEVNLHSLAHGRVGVKDGLVEAEEHSDRVFPRLVGSCTELVSRLSPA